MSNEYKDWLSEQTFETLAEDNLRVKKQLLKLTQKLEKARGLIENLLRISKRCFAYGTAVFDMIDDLAQQALKELDT